jgi:ribosomal-protein-alanine N-acetyltransferase
LEIKELVIRDCEIADLSSIQEIEVASFDDPYPPWLFQSLYKDRNRIFRVASFQGRTVGYSIAKLERDETIMHVLSLAVGPLSFRNRGVGSELMKDLISQTKHNFLQCKRLKLEVRKDNKEAIALYSKFAFQKTAELVNYYGKGKNALVMELLI